MGLKAGALLVVGTLLLSLHAATAGGGESLTEVAIEIVSPADGSTIRAADPDGASLLVRVRG